MAFIELIIISWFYGVDGFFKNVEEMKIKIPGFMKIYWKTCWLFITPVLIGKELHTVCFIILYPPVKSYVVKWP